jgi:DNA-binding transcriptional LysR family regulator
VKAPYTPCIVARARDRHTRGHRYPEGITTVSTISDVDLRKLRYFLAVAEQLNFTRAAAELRIAQPVLSRQIRALEAELNAQLFLRDRRRTELTAAGRELVAEATGLLAGAQALRLRVARAAASGAGRTADAD